MVKTGRLEPIIEILTSQMNHWVFFPLVMTALGISMGLMGNSIEETPDLLLWAVCGLIPVVLFLIRYYVERVWLLVLCHGGVLAAVLSAALLLYSNGAVICMICGAVYIICSLRLRLSGKRAVYSESIHPLGAAGLSVAANLLFHIEEGMPDWDGYYLFTLIGVLACYLILYYLKHYLDFLRVNRSSAGYLPAGEMLRSGLGLVIPYTLSGAVILLLSLHVEWLEPVFTVLKKGLKKLLQFFFGLLSAGREAEGPVPVQEGGGHAPAGEMLMLPEAEHSLFWDVLEYAVLILFACSCVFALLWGLKRLVGFLRKRFGRKGPDGDDAGGQEDIFDLREKCNPEKRSVGSKRRGMFQRFTPKERVRRLYKKKVLVSGLAAEDRRALNCMTAGECGAALSLPEMAELYEQARYSDKEITFEDVKRMKDACSRAG
ncbi:MAG: hypothetical protein NC123_02185 [Butyrivibrio sp.]|nr:hypothetical protein [Acetatifactor muris]MCM1558349.1 hypothetical protein [Butyrivibrio sp.]